MYMYKEHVGFKENNDEGWPDYNQVNFGLSANLEIIRVRREHDTIYFVNDH